MLFSSWWLKELVAYIQDDTRIASLLFALCYPCVSPSPQAHGRLDPLAGLKRWKTPEKDWENFGSSHFMLFRPDNLRDLTKVGKVYRLIGIPEDLPPGAMFSNNRYHPPHLTDDTDIMLHRLLVMFHPRPFVLARFAPHGSLACVQAYNEDYVKIAFRWVSLGWIWALVVYITLAEVFGPLGKFWFLTLHAVPARQPAGPYQGWKSIPPHWNPRGLTTWGPSQ